MFYKYFLFFENIYYCWSVLFNISCLPVKIVPHWSWNVRSVCILRTEILPPVLFEAPAFICCCSEHKNAPLVSAITIHDRMSLKRFYLLLHFIKLFKFFKPQYLQHHFQFILMHLLESTCILFPSGTAPPSPASLSFLPTFIFDQFLVGPAFYEEDKPLVSVDPLLASELGSIR